MKSRKIGVLTMGITLVAFGVLFLLRAFIDGLDWISVMRFWPVVLIGLGIEVLISALIPPKEGQPRARVDALSIVVLFLALFLAFGLAAGQFVIEQINEHNWGWRRGSSVVSTQIVELEDGLTLHLTANAQGDELTMEYWIHTDGSVYGRARFPYGESGQHNMMVLVCRETEERYLSTRSRSWSSGELQVAQAYFEFWNLHHVSPADFVLRYRIHVELSPAGDGDVLVRTFEGEVALGASRGSRQVAHLSFPLPETDGMEINERIDLGNGRYITIEQVELIHRSAHDDGEFPMFVDGWDTIVAVTYSGNSIPHYRMRINESAQVIGGMELSDTQRVMFQPYMGEGEITITLYYSDVVDWPTL